MAIILIIYLIGVGINLLLTLIEENGFKEPIWKTVLMFPKRKETWIAVLDKVLFIGGSFISYMILGIIYYIMMWRS